MSDFEIPREVASKIIKELSLSVGCSFTNMESSYLCPEYRVETGYWLDGGSSRLINLVNRKNESGELLNESYICLDGDVFGNENKIEMLEGKVNNLETFIKELMKVVEFYRKPENWHETEVCPYSDYRGEISRDDWSRVDIDEYYYEAGGKRAREIMKHEMWEELNEKRRCSKMG